MLVDATTLELQTIEHAGKMGGEYLDEIKKTDLEKLTTKEWNTFIGVVIAAYVNGSPSKIPF